MENKDFDWWDAFWILAIIIPFGLWAQDDLDRWIGLTLFDVILFCFGAWLGGMIYRYWPLLKRMLL